MLFRISHLWLKAFPHLRYPKHARDDDEQVLQCLGDRPMTIDRKAKLTAQFIHLHVNFPRQALVYGPLERAPACLAMVDNGR